MGMKKIAAGESDFKKIITGNYFYVDKSLFIKEIIDRGDTVLTSTGKELKPYRIDTPDNEIIENLLSKEGKELSKKTKRRLA